MTAVENTPQTLSLLQDLVQDARRRGADAADAVAVQGTALSCVCRLGRVESLERSESRALGLRLFLGQRQAVVSGKDWSPAALAELVERGLAMARVVPENPYAGLAGPDQLLAGPVPALDLCDTAPPPGPEALIHRARTAEDAARAVPGVTNSEGAEADCSHTTLFLAASNGFAGSYATSSHGVGVSVLAGSGAGMERDYDFHNATHAADLRDAAAVGRRAGDRAVARLNPVRLATARMPVVFHPRVAAGLLRHLAGAVNGVTIARKASFLQEALGRRIMPVGVTVIEDPHRPRGLASLPFDAEGLPTMRRALVSDGVLQGWILDLASARQLGLPPTGNARRGVSGPPAPGVSNLYLEPGALSPAALMADIRDGFFVTDVMGMGVNGVTGDYSQGASGFRIQQGQITTAVSEVTVAGNLLQMFAGLAVADDLEFTGAVSSPTLRVDGMTVAGS